jgi:uncharacterized protein (TIGR03382 family)
MKSGIFGAAAVAVASIFSGEAATFNGNGATGFGGPVGTGSLAINDSLSDISFTLNRGTGVHNDILVVYLDTQPGGFTDTSLFNDSGDAGRTAISGAAGTTRTTVNFAAGFGADYALSIENGFIGVFDLAGGEPHTYLFGQAQTGGNSAASYTLTLDAAQMNQIGIVPGSGESFNFVGTLISGTAYRSDETIGASTTVGADGGPNPGFSNPLTFTESLTFTTVPEPGTVALGVMGAVAAFLFRRRR